MNENLAYVGLDVHKDSITIAVARAGREPAEKWGTIPYDVVRLRKVLKMVAKGGMAKMMRGMKGMLPGM